jgi:hypothetical protein
VILRFIRPKRAGTNNRRPQLLSQGSLVQSELSAAPRMESQGLDRQADNPMDELRSSRFELVHKELGLFEPAASCLIFEV